MIMTILPFNTLKEVMDMIDYIIKKNPRLSKATIHGWDTGELFVSSSFHEWELVNLYEQMKKTHG